MKKNTYLIFLFVPVLLYLLIRAIYVPLLHDEIATFFRFIHVERFIPYHSEWTTNNHFLNSLLTWFSYKVFGSSPIAQRLPNLLFIPVFFWFLYKLSLELKSNTLRWIFILIILSFHNFIDFFSFSRGYGMSLAMLTGSIWFTIRAIKFNQIRDYIYALTSMLLSVSAILIMVNSYIIIIGILTLNTIYHDQKSLAKMGRRFLLIFFMGIIPVILVVIYLLDLKDVGRLDYGGMEGFWEVSIISLTNLLLGSYSTILNILILILFPLMVMLYTYLLASNKKDSFFTKFMNYKWILFYLLIGNILGFILENKLFGILYPEERTSIQFVLFFVGGLIFLLDELKPEFSRYRIIPLLPFFLLPVHFIYSMNLDFSKADTFNFNIPDSFYETVESHQQDGNFPPTVQAYQLRIMRWNWHNFTKKGEQSCIHSSGYPQLDGDFQIVMADENPAWEKYYETVDTEELSGAVLLKRKKILERRQLYYDNTLSFKSEDEFLVISEGSLDTLKGRSLYFGFKVELVTPAKPFHTWIVIEARDEDDKVLRYEYLPFDWFRTSWKPGDKTFVNGLLVNDLPSSSSKYVCYLWNIYKVPFSIDHLELSVYELARDY